MQKLDGDVEPQALAHVVRNGDNTTLRIVLAAAQAYPLSEIEVRLVRTPHGGCFGPCVQYEIVVRGDGTVEYNGVGLVEGTRTRTIAVDEVVAFSQPMRPSPRTATLRPTGL